MGLSSRGGSAVARRTWRRPTALWQLTFAPLRLLLLLRLALPAVALFRSSGLYRQGEFRINPIDFFDCSGPNFDPIWDKWYEAVVAWEEGLDGAISEGIDRPMFGAGNMMEIGQKVANMSHILLEEWFHHVQAVEGRGLDKVIHRALAPSDLKGVCYYGLVQALWVRTQLIVLQPHSEQDLAEAMLELQTATEVLGEDGRADYLESTRWPMKALEIRMTLRTGQISKAPNFKDVRFLANLETSLLGDGFVQMHPQINFYKHAPKELPEGSGMGILKISAFGQHLGLLSEPVSMLRAAVGEWKIVTNWFLAQCRWQDPMHHYMCRLACMLIGECAFYDDRDNLGRRILKYVDHVSEGSRLAPREELEEFSSITSLLDLTAQLWDENAQLQSSHLIVCTVPLLCSLLRSVCPLPMMGLFSMTHFSRAQVGVGEWGMMHFAEMAKNTDQNVFATPALFLSEMSVLHIGVRLPTVRPFGFYNFRDVVKDLFPNPFAQLFEGTGSYPNSVIVPRSWAITETSFIKVLRYFVEGVTPNFPLNFTIIRTFNSEKTDVNMARNPHPGGEHLSDLMSREENVFVEGASMIKYRCALMVPQHPHIMTAYEIHSVNLPIFMPGPEWLPRILAQMRAGSRGPADKVVLPGGYKPNTRPRPMKPPFFTSGVVHVPPSISQFVLFERKYSYGLPGIRFVHSMPDLLDGLLFDDLPARRELMRRHNEAELEPVMHWYRSAVLHLLSGPPHYFLGKS
mmetsp:Transcript_58476/g.190707  ORF Transcript_58476/g.190707 Transcript_58476/m.190707 type:complete len:741 (+) Transcript_58476:232-2454(+)